MDNFIRQGLNLHQIPFKENELHYIQDIFFTIFQAQAQLETVPELNEEVPITIVDPEVIQYD